jgi:hypothetical protein
VVGPVTAPKATGDGEATGEVVTRAPLSVTVPSGVPVLDTVSVAARLAAAPVPGTNVKLRVQDAPAAKFAPHVPPCVKLVGFAPPVA